MQLLITQPQAQRYGRGRAERRNGTGGEKKEHKTVKVTFKNYFILYLSIITHIHMYTFFVLVYMRVYIHAHVHVYRMQVHLTKFLTRSCQESFSSELGGRPKVGCPGAISFPLH